MSIHAMKSKSLRRYPRVLETLCALFLFTVFFESMVLPSQSTCLILVREEFGNVVEIP